MKTLILVILSFALTTRADDDAAKNCLSDPDKALTRYEVLEPLVLVSIGVKGNVQFDIQEIADKVNPDNSSILVGQALSYRVMQDMVPGYFKSETPVPLTPGTPAVNDAATNHLRN